MPKSLSPLPMASFGSFGELLRYLRRRARLSQRELSIAVGYSESQISRLENNQSAPDTATLAALFVPALLLEDEPETAARLLELAAAVREAPTTQRASEAALNRQSLAASPHLTNLPIQLTSFIGREHEMAEVKRLLAHSPLVTLIGVGGSGKTRLALQVATELLTRYPDGVWLIELAPLSDPEIVPRLVAIALRVVEEPGRSLVKTLIDHLRPQSLLLILDNCEHLIDACAELADSLLRGSPNLKLLVTSREALGIAGETVFSVPPLSLPDVHQLSDVATVMRSEAVRLFVDRAVAAKPDFTVTDTNAPSVAQICHRLDGIPLALELAAARVRALSVDQIAARLDDRFQLLTGGSRTALPRHQTLLALVDWSYDLLPEAERVLLRRLSVFRGGWTLEAAEAVCVGEKSEAAEVLNLLTHLVDKSLVVVEEQDREMRYHMLETIREYALRRLVESGEAESIRRQHVHFFLSLAEAAESHIEGPSRWRERLEAEDDNLRAALNWAYENAVDVGVRLASVLQLFWYWSGNSSEGRDWFERALRLTIPAKARATALSGAGLLAWMQGEYTVARSLYSESATLHRETGDKRGLAYSLCILGKMVELVEGPHETTGAGRSLQEESIAIARELGDQWNLALALSYLGASIAARGDDATAHALQQESVAIYRGLGNDLRLATPLCYLGYLALRRGDYATARSLFEESLMFRQAAHTHQWGIAWRLEGFAALAILEGEPERAARLFGAAEVVLESTNSRLDWIDRLGYDQYVATAREQLGEAAFAEAWAEGRTMTMEQALTYAVSKTPP
jgi:predicted ATPase/transcriptional regulator with XRE-family HTH domain